MPKKPANRPHSKQSRITFEGKPPAGLVTGAELTIEDRVCSGDLVRFRRNRDGQLSCRLLNDSQVARARGPVYLASKQRGAVRFRRLDDPPTFGDFPFATFTTWMAAQLLRASEAIFDRYEQYTSAVERAGLDAFEVPMPVAAHAVDMAYLAILALALHHSLGQDLLDGDIPPSVLMSDEPLRRARAMLRYHADILPVKVDSAGVPALLDERAGLVAQVLLPVAVSGFEAPSPVAGALVEQLPRPLIKAWKKHEYRDDPLCQLMIVTFYLAFGAFVPGDNARYWQPLISTYWSEWTDVLLAVRYGISTGDLYRQMTTSNPCSRTWYASRLQLQAAVRRLELRSCVILVFRSWHRFW